MKGFWQRGLWVCNRSCICGKDRRQPPFTLWSIERELLGETPESMLGVQELEAVSIGCDRAGGIAKPAALAPGLREQGEKATLPHWRPLGGKANPKRSWTPGDLVPPGRYSWLTSPLHHQQMRYTC